MCRHDDMILPPADVGADPPLHDKAAGAGKESHIFLLPFPANCIYACEAMEMRVNSRVQKTWLRLFGAADSSLATRVARIEEGYYAAVHETVKGTMRHVAGDDEDFQAVKSLVPDLGHTRAIFLKQESDYGLPAVGSLGDWAGQFKEQVARGTLHAFAIVNTEVFAREVSATLRAAGWNVERAQDRLRVSDGRFVECINLLRAMVYLVLSRGTFAEAGRWLKGELAGRFHLAARLFARFEKRFAPYRPAVLDRYFTVCPDCSRLAAGWDYWQVSSRDARGATEIFEQAMNEFECLLAMPQTDWLPAPAGDCCKQNILNSEVIHD